MDQLGMKAMDISFRSADGRTAGGKTQKTSDEFLSMLQSKQAGSQDSKEVSEDTKTEKGDTADDTKKEPVSEEKNDKTDKTEQPDKQEEDTSQAEGMMAAYQASQRLRPEIITIAPEAEPAVMAEDVSVEADMAAETVNVEDAVSQMLDAEVMQPVRQDNTVDQTDAASMFDAASVQAADVNVVVQAQPSETRQESSDLSSGLKEEKTEQPQEVSQTQTDHLMTGHMAAAAEPTNEVQIEEPKNEYVSVVHVEEPEEIPEKVTDQLLAKIVEGVQEFEIHIEPVNLGKIAIKIMYEGSQANISIVCNEKRAWEALSQNAKEIGNIIERNLGGETTIVVEKQENDYLNQTRDENEQARQDEQQKQKEQNKEQNGEDAEQFLQKLRLGLAG